MIQSRVRAGNYAAPSTDHPSRPLFRGRLAPGISFITLDGCHWSRPFFVVYILSSVEAPGLPPPSPLNSLPLILARIGRPLLGTAMALLVSGKLPAAPGTIPNRSYPTNQVLKQISPQLSSRHLNQPSVINGYAIFAGNAEHEVWDISNPYNPTHLADMISNHAAGEAESHQVTYHRRGNTLYMATISGRGIDIWDVTDTPNPHLVSELILPGINYGDVSGAIWGLSWEGEHIYAGATTNGLYVIEVQDPAAPRHAATMTRAELGGVVAGPLFAIGNLLVITSPKETRGIATVDISDPTHPRLLDAEIEGSASYIGGFYGTHAYLITPFRAYDVTTDPRNIQKTGQATVPNSEYMSFGDDKFFLGGLRGGTQGIYKYDIANPSSISLEGRFVGRDSRWDDQFSCPVGNLLLVADDQLVNNRYVGGLIAVHSAAPDTTPPRVKYVNPPNGAQRQPVTTRVGVSLSDWPELTSVDAASFIVRPVGGAPVAGTWSTTTTTLNFMPSAPLAPATTYEIILPAGGIKDLVGNPIATEFRSEFTTAPVGGGFPGNDEINPVPPTELGTPTTFSVKNPDPASLYRWKLPDDTILEGVSVSHTYATPGRYVVTLESRPNLDQKTEAEDAQRSGGVVVATDHPGYTGTGFADYPSNTGANVALRWTVTASAATTGSLTIRYASSNARPLHLVVNGGTPQFVDFPATLSFAVYGEVVVPDVAFQAGENTLELRASAGSAGPNVDSMTVRFADPPDLETRTSSFLHLVYRELTPNAPTSSQALCLDPANDLVWAANSDADTVTAVSLDTLAKVREVAVGEQPETLARAPDGTIWVANRRSHSLSVVQPATGAVTTISLPYASQPFGLAFAPDGGSAYVALQARGALAKLDPATRQVVSVLEFPSDANGIRPQVRGVAVSADSQKIYVSRFISPSVGGEVFEVSASPFALSRVVALAPSTGPDSPMHARGIPNYLNSLTISPDGLRAWVPSKQDNIFRGLARDGLALDHDVTVRAVASQMDLAAGGEVAGSRLDFDDRDRAHSVSFSPLGDLVFVTMPGNNHVSVHDAYNGQEVTRIFCGVTPVAAVLDPTRSRLHVLNFLSRDLSVFDVSYLLNGVPFTPYLALTPLIASEPLSAPVLRGKVLFYDATSTKLNSEKYMSCASCHLDGDQDGQVWDLSSLGEGLRNTIELRGRAGTRHGRLHWSGNFDEVHDFENQIRTLGSGEGLMSDAQFLRGTRREPLGNTKAGLSADLDALSAYVSSLDRFEPSPYRKPDGGLTADAVAGREIFNALRCYDCHGGQNFTDSRMGLLHDVGTLKATSGSRLGGPLTGLDTPTLRGVWSGAPYLHDGSAPTLRHVLTTANPADRHGVTSPLTNGEINQLVAYLNQIDGSEPPARAASGVGAPSYDVFIANFPGITGPDAGESVDFDHDSFINLAEYALGATDAAQSGSAPPLVTRLVTDEGEQYLSYSYLRLKGGHWENGAYHVSDLVYRPEVSDNLQQWKPEFVELATPADLPAAPEHYEWGTFGCLVPPDAASRFVRVSVRRAAPEEL